MPFRKNRSKVAAPNHVRLAAIKLDVEITEEHRKIFALLETFGGYGLPRFLNDRLASKGVHGGDLASLRTIGEMNGRYEGRREPAKPWRPMFRLALDELDQWQRDERCVLAPRSLIALAACMWKIGDYDAVAQAAYEARHLLRQQNDEGSDFLRLANAFFAFGMFYWGHENLEEMTSGLALEDRYDELFGAQFHTHCLKTLKVLHQRRGGHAKAAELALRAKVASANSDLPELPDQVFEVEVAPS
jgi:hypothetical protein